MNGKNGQVFNSLIVFLASNYEQLAITFFLTRNQKSLTSVLTNHAHRKINSFSTPIFWQQTKLYKDYYSSKGKLLLILYLKQINSRYKNVAQVKEYRLFLPSLSRRIVLLCLRPKVQVLTLTFKQPKYSRFSVLSHLVCLYIGVFFQKKL